MESIKKEERNHETWLANYQGNSLIQYRRAWENWTRYMGSKDEKWILENKDTEDWSAHLVNFHRWLKLQPKRGRKGTLSDNTAKVFANAIRGYLRHIGITVGLSKVQRTEISNVESQPTRDYPFDLRVKEELLRVANSEEEYVVCTGVSFGLRVSDFAEITRGHIEPFLDKEVPIQLPEIITKKEGIKAYPHIDRDAYNAIKRYLREMDIQGRTKPNDRMLDLSGRQINSILKELFKKAGISCEEYTVRFHILRKFLTDKLASVCSGDKWKWFVGKKATSPYVSEQGREAYQKVMEFTCVNHKSINRGATSEVLERLDSIEGELTRTGHLLEIIVEDVLTEEQRAKVRKLSKKHFGEEYPGL